MSLTRPPKRDVIAAVACLMLAAAAFLFVFGGVFFGEAIWWSPRSLATSRSLGDELILALEQFRADHQAYPQTLEQLTPTYIDAVKQPTAGERVWRYRVHDGGESFTLSFAYDELNYPVCFFESRRGEWWEDH